MENERFNEWWYNEGSALTPDKADDMESHAKRVASIAWANGEYTKDEATRELLEHKNTRISQLARDMRHERNRKK